MKPPSSQSEIGVDARRAALRLLDAVLRRGLPLEAALESAGRDLAGADRGLAHAIAAETLRRLPDLDALIDSATQQRLPPDSKARFALRIALVQGLALGTPGHAAISTVLPLVDGGPRRLVHGVFGALMRRKVALPSPPTLPRAVEERWVGHWGRDMVDSARAAMAAPPPLDLSFRDDTEARRFDGRHLAISHARIPAQSRITDLPGFAEGAWWVQDLAASLPARLLGRGKGDVLDLCAAPGGKTLQLAAAGWTVTAVDNSAHRLERLRENLDRTRLSAAVVEADVLNWTPDKPVDAILLDAPCSATGIFRRHPDVLHRVRTRHIAEMAELQQKMLARARDWLKPGGTLVYATCSLEPEEGEAQLSNATGLVLDPIAAAELPNGVTPHAIGYVRTLPGTLADKGGMDGFFIVRFKRA